MWVVGGKKRTSGIYSACLAWSSFNRDNLGCFAATGFCSSSALGKNGKPRGRRHIRATKHSFAWAYNTPISDSCRGLGGLTGSGHLAFAHLGSMGAKRFRATGPRAEVGPKRVQRVICASGCIWLEKLAIQEGGFFRGETCIRAAKLGGVVLGTQRGGRGRRQRNDLPINSESLD